MTDPTATTDPPRWRTEETGDADLAPSAFPMPDGEQGDTACTGEPDDGPDYGDAHANDPALPPQFDPTSVVPLANTGGFVVTYADEVGDMPASIPCVRPDCPPIEEEQLGRIQVGVENPDGTTSGPIPGTIEETTDGA